MEDSKVNKKVLIGVGCSHVQGCAVIDDVSIVDNYEIQVTDGEENYTKDIYELGSPELKELYGKEKVSAEWITENITWMGHLGKLLGVDEILNFGAGGRGIECNIRTLKNYAFRNKDLSNHIIFWMLPSFERKEVLRKKYNGWEYTQLVNSISKALDSESQMDEKDRQSLLTYAENFHHREPIRYNFLLEIYFTQEYLKSLGAKVYIFDFFNDDLEELSERNYDEDFVRHVMNSDASHYGYYKAPYIPIRELLGKLDLISHKVFWYKNVQKKVNTKYESMNLKDAKLKDDRHLSPDGNKWLAEMLFYCHKNYKNLIEWKRNNSVPKIH